MAGNDLVVPGLPVPEPRSRTVSIGKERKTWELSINTKTLPATYSSV